MTGNNLHKGISTPFLLSSLAILFIFTSQASASLILQVNPNANNSDGKFNSIQAARDAIRKIKAAGPLTEPITVIISPATYPLTEPITFTAQDSGTADYPISYIGHPSGTPEFTGGQIITGFKQTDDGLWQTKIPDVAQGKWYFEQLFVNDRRATRARTPNEFYFHMNDIKETPLQNVPGKQARQTVYTYPNDFKVLQSIPADQLKDTMMVVYHKWDNTRRFIDSIDPTYNAIITSGEKMKPWNSWQKSQRYILENFKNALDAPGEWFLSRDGTLYYKPLPGQTINNTTIIAPHLEKFLILKGDEQKNEFVQYINFKNISFAHTQYLSPPGGFEPQQAAQTIDAAVMLDCCQKINFHACKFSHIGTYGIWFRHLCQNNSLNQCFVYDTAAGFVRIGETNRAPSEEKNTRFNTIENNIFYSGGFTFPCAVGIWVGQSSDNTIIHNDISDLYYTGISIGWSWGYNPTTCHRNKVLYNNVHHIGYGVLSDMGGIYTLGLSEGTVIANNVFHDIYAYSYGGWGLYTDEGSTGILMENNLVYNVKTGSFHQHYGKENIVRNNILAFSKLHQLQATRSEEHLSFTLENNIIYYDSDTLLQGRWKEAKTILNKNCYWNCADKPVKFLDMDLAQWQATGHDKDSIIADPLFVDAKNHDFHLKPNSPALKLGFKPFDYTLAGVTGPKSWTQKAKYLTYPELKIAPPAPPVIISESFEDQPLDKAPIGSENHTENKGDSITVTNELAATGKQSLKITDAPGLTYRYNPHYVLRPNHAKGQSLASFDLLIEEGADINFEYRDWTSNPYYTGPTFAINNNTIKLPNGKNIPLPNKTWAHFKIETPLGENTPNIWTLTITIKNQTHTFDNLKYRSNKFKTLNWFGFTSNANNKTSFYLDNINIRFK